MRIVDGVGAVADEMVVGAAGLVTFGHVAIFDDLVTDLDDFVVKV